MNLGYARVSTSGQTLESQLEQLGNVGCLKIFSEKASGNQSDRVELRTLVKSLQPGAVVVVTRLDRLARSTIDLLTTIKQIAANSGLNTARFQGVLDSVQASYMDLFAFRDIFAKGVPIIGHCYDYAIPNNVHPICTPSAWLWPSISFAGYDYNEGLNIISQMIDGFYTMLSKLAADPKNNFTVFDTRNTLTRNAAQPNGWANEIHPYFTGFTVLANKFLTNLQAVPQFKSRV
jgi:Resolvase, N terminal domain